MAAEQTQNAKQQTQGLNALEKSLQAYMQQAGADFANTIQNFNASGVGQSNKPSATPPVQQATDATSTQGANSSAIQSVANNSPATMHDFIRRMHELNKQYS